jgi:hypothetical protein
MLNVRFNAKGIVGGYLARFMAMAQELAPMVQMMSKVRKVEMDTHLAGGLPPRLIETFLVICLIIISTLFCGF